LMANRLGAASARRRVVRGYLDASAEWEEYSNGYLRVSESMLLETLHLRKPQNIRNVDAAFDLKP